MSEKKLFEAALGIEKPWYVKDVQFELEKCTLTIEIDFERGTRFAYPSMDGVHPVYDTQTKRYRHMNFFQHECYLEVRVPRVSLPDGSVHLIEPPFSGKLAGFTLLFEALVLVLCRQMTISGCARMMNVSGYKVSEICRRYVEGALEFADYSDVRHLGIDETSRSRGHNYVTIAADFDKRSVIFVAEGRDADTIRELQDDLLLHGGDPASIETVSIDMSPAYIQGVGKYLPNAEITFDKYHVIAHASEAVDRTRREEQKQAPELKGMRWILLKDRSQLSPSQERDLDDLMRYITTKRTARAWLYKEQLKEILSRKQIHVVGRMLKQWCTNVNRSKVAAMKEVASMILNHFDGIVSWARTRQTNGFLEALHGLFQAAKRKARGYSNFITIRTVIFLLMGKLNFSCINPYVAILPT